MKEKDYKTLAICFYINKKMMNTLFIRELRYFDDSDVKNIDKEYQIQTQLEFSRFRKLVLYKICVKKFIIFYYLSNVYLANVYTKV